MQQCAWSFCKASKIGYEITLVPRKLEIEPYHSRQLEAPCCTL